MFEIKFDVKLDSGVVNCRTYTLREHTALNIARSNSTSELMKTAYDNIIRENTNAVNLPKHDAELLLVQLIARSENYEDVIQDYVCECGHEIPVKLDLNSLNVNYNGTDIRSRYSIGNFDLEFRWPKLWADDNVGKMIVDCIKAIYVNDEVIGVEDLNDKELDVLYASLTEDHIHYIKQMLLAPKVSLAVPIKCPECGKYHVHVIEGFKQFVEIL